MVAWQTLLFAIELESPAAVIGLTHSSNNSESPVSVNIDDILLLSVKRIRFVLSDRSIFMSR